MSLSKRKKRQGTERSGCAAEAAVWPCAASSLPVRSNSAIFQLILISKGSTTMRIGLVAAMPEECAPLLKRVAGYATEKIERFSAFRFRTGSAEACLVRSGMGPERAAAAAGALISTFQPEAVISFGL